jgi:curved DNA-binding protein CbpA
MTDYYALLEVNRQASPEVIDKAYRALALKYHPDLHPEHGETMRQLNEAYAVLSNPETRAQYDQKAISRRVKLPKPLVWFGVILLALLLLRWVLWFFLMTVVGNVLLALATTYALIRLRRSR